MKVAEVFYNRKADISARKVIFYIVSSILLVAVFFIIIWINLSNKSLISEMPIGLENYLIVQRFLNSPSCSVSIDKDTNRAYPWIIDPKKFNQENLNVCYGAQDTKVKAYRLTLTYGSGKNIISTKNWEGFLKKAETNHIFVNDEGKIQRAELFIETQDAK